MDQSKERRDRIETWLSEVWKEPKTKWLIAGVLMALIFKPLLEEIALKAIVSPFLAKIESNGYTDIAFVLLTVFLLWITRTALGKRKVDGFSVVMLVISLLIYSYYRWMEDLWVLTSFSNSLKDHRWFAIIFYLVCAVFVGVMVFKKRSLPALITPVILIGIVVFLNLIPFKLKYVDLFFFLGLDMLIGGYFFPLKAFDKKTGDAIIGVDPWLADAPAGKNGVADKFQYEKYVNTIVRQIRAGKYETAFAIGINGTWGTGKTSFLNLLEVEFEKQKEEIILINYKPWNSHSPIAIMQDFFDTMQDAIRASDPSLSNKLTDYLNKLMRSEEKGSQWSRVLSLFFPRLGTLNHLFDEINKSIENSGNKIVVVIDDLDRLDKAEILEVIRLIRNTANFKRTYFIAAYDRNYVLKALHDAGYHNHEQFLEKIFQLEITLPMVDNRVYRTTLKDNLKTTVFSEDYYYEAVARIRGSEWSKVCTAEEKKRDRDQFEKWQAELDELDASDEVDKWLNNMRDVTRLTNSLIINLSSLAGEVRFMDFLHLELLRMKYPAVYELLHKETQVFLEAEEIWFLSSDRKKRLEAHLELHCEQLGVPATKITKVVSLIEELFPNPKAGDTSEKLKVDLSWGDLSDEQKADQMENWVMKNKHQERSAVESSIIQTARFERYFTYVLRDWNLSEAAFCSARCSTNFIAKVRQWKDENLQEELMAKLIAVKRFTDLKDFEQLILGMVELGSDKSYTDELVKYILKRMSSHYVLRLYNPEYVLKAEEAKRQGVRPSNKPWVNEFYHLDQGERGGFMTGLLKLPLENEGTDLFKLKLLNELSIRLANEGILFMMEPSMSDLSNVRLENMEQFCARTNKIDERFWLLIDPNTDWTMSKTDSEHINKQETSFRENFPRDKAYPQYLQNVSAIKKMGREFICKDLDAFINASIISIKSSNGFYTEFALSPETMCLFDAAGSAETIDELARFMDEQDDTARPNLKEFKEFLTNLIDRGGCSASPKVPFDFYIIRP